MLDQVREVWEFAGFIDTALGALALAWGVWLWRRRG
jgi:hypothetical protein